MKSVEIETVNKIFQFSSIPIKRNVTNVYNSIYYLNCSRHFFFEECINLKMILIDASEASVLLQFKKKHFLFLFISVNHGKPEEQEEIDQGKSVFPKK